jgi:tetratricopeptide (TPR) repeat protein
MSKRRFYPNTGYFELSPGEISGSKEDISGLLFSMDSPHRKSNSSPTSTQYFEKGYSLLNKGHYKDSIPYFSESLKIDSQFVASLLYKGFAHFKISQYKEALDSYSKVLNIDTIDSNYAKSYLGQGKVYAYENFDHEDMYDPKRALYCFERSIELYSKSVECWIELVDIYIKFERFDDAIKATQESLKLGSKNPDVWIAASAFYEFMSIKCTEKASELNPTNELIQERLEIKDENNIWLDMNYFFYVRSNEK